MAICCSSGKALRLRFIVLCAALTGSACSGDIGERLTSGSSDDVARPGVTATTSGAGGSTGTPGAVSGPLVVGRAPLRRLTRAEYNNTVRTLLSDTSNPASKLEPDTLADGFTNNADTQNVGTSLAQGYLDAAEAMSVTATKNLPALLGCDPNGAEAACLRSFIQQFGKRAWRRPLLPAEVDHLAGVYTKGRASFDIATSTQMVLQVMLLSPFFLYRVERGVPTPGAKTVALTSWEMASRLSYFLVGSMPDADLFAAAESNALTTAEQVASQSKRLLSASGTSAQDRFAQFFTEWLHLVNIDQLQKDTTKFAAFTPGMGALLRQETETFVKKTLFEGPGDLSTLFTAPYSFPSPEVAKLYGAQAPGADGRLNLDPNQRAGLLTQPSILATFAKSDSTDPVHRGKFIWEGLFCGSVPAPPANVNISPPKITPGTTARVRFEQHRASAACASCHIVMDPVGLTLEHFDAVGRWRDTEDGLAIDVSGKLSGTDVDGPFVGAVELAQKLAVSQQVSTCAVRQLFRFAFGRYDTPEDAATIDYLAAQLASGNKRLLDLATSMTQVPAFLQLQVAQ